MASDGTPLVRPCTPDEFGYRSSPFRDAVVLDAVVQLTPGDRPEIHQRMRAALAAKAASQPLSAASAGCMFRNSAEAPSGRLIDEAGCKGMREGAVEVSRRHANFVVNTGGGSAGDVVRLVQRVRRAVREHSGAELELEVECWGDLDLGP